MAVIFIEGFDKYRRIASALFNGVWDAYVNFLPTDQNFIDGFQGDAFVCAQNAGLLKILQSNYPTVIWGCRFSTPVLNGFCVKIGDGTVYGVTDQITVRINSSGNVEVRRGSEGGPVGGLQPSTLLDTSIATISINTWHYLEARITLNDVGGSYDIYLDNVNIISNVAQNTSASGNNYANTFCFKSIDDQTDVYVKDIYIFDTTTAFNNDVVGDSIVETQFPESDASVSLTIGAASFGASYSYTNSTISPGANKLALRKFTPLTDCIINSITIVPANTNPTAKYKMVLYSDLSNVPNILMSDGTEVIGTTTGIPLTGNLVNPQILVGGTPYWIGFYTDTSVTLTLVDTSTIYGFIANNTYTSGAPLTAPVMTGGQEAWILWGNVTTNDNFAELQNPLSEPLVNYISNTAVNDEDQYNFPPLSINPLNVWAVKVSAFGAAITTGNISLRVKSGAVVDDGDDANQLMSSLYQYFSSNWNNDPNTGLAWTNSTVNNATSGVKVLS